MHKRPAILLLSLALCVVVLGCSAPAPAPAPAPGVAAAAARDEADYVFVYLKTGPRSAEKTPEESQKIFEGHMANIGRLAEERKLVIAGPYGQGAHDGNLRGIFVFDVPTVDEARALTESDPGVQSGVFTLEAHPLRASTDLRRIHDLDREDKDVLARSGKPAGPAANIRGYVMLTASDAAQAESALRDVIAQGKLIWSGRFGGDLQGGGVYVLDAADVAACKELLGPALARLGDCWIDPWWSTRSLERLPAVSRAAHDGGS